MTGLLTEPAEAPVPARRRRSRSASRATVLALQILAVLAVLGLWQLAHVSGWGRPVVVQSPGRMFEALGDLIAQPVFWTNFAATLLAALTALVLAIVIGAPVGLVIGSVPTASRVFTPLINAINAMPRIALAPVFIVIFGIATPAKVAMAFSLAIFVMIVNAQAGGAAADQEAVRMLTSIGASRGQILRKIVLPAAVPSLVAGSRLAVIMSLLGVISSELIAARDGLGLMIVQSTGIFDMATTYALLVVLVVTAAVINFAGDVAERRLLRWRPPVAR
ncbi:ABC transporter permease [Amycolatopsis thermoflava]|uniref:ABC transporter permease n=1 Tax=Amycolatopsis thermoflava TaxID=84480 RepID=UPI00381324D5